MGYATTIGGCGCVTIRIMESGNIIEYTRCAKHYVPEDDVIILEAVKNRREHEKQFWDDANEFWNKR